MRNAVDRLPAFGLGMQSKLALLGVALVKMYRDGMTQAEVAGWAMAGLAGDASFTAALVGVLTLGAVGHDVVQAALLVCRPDPKVVGR